MLRSKRGCGIFKEEEEEEEKFGDIRGRQGVRQFLLFFLLLFKNTAPPLTPQHCYWTWTPLVDLSSSSSSSLKIQHALLLLNIPIWVWPP